MSLENIVKKLKGLKEVNLVDVAMPLPENKDELVDYFKEKNPDKWDPKYESQLAKIADEVHNEYKEHLGDTQNYLDRAANSLSAVGDGLYLANPLYAFFPKAVATGLKATNHMYEAAKGAFGAGYFGKSPKDYASLPLLLAGDLLNMAPYGTALSPGIARVVKKRMAKEVKKRFMQETGQYKPLHERIKDSYKTQVKDRAARFFKPSYESKQVYQT